MSEPQDWAESVTTMGGLARELRRRRLAAGFSSVPKLRKNLKEGDSLPRSTAYGLEKGAHVSDWIAFEAYLRACNATDSEIAEFHEVYKLVLSRSRGQEPSSSQQEITPTAKQLAEMGPEEAARLLSEIDPDMAADLLRRIDIRPAAKIVPEIRLSVVLSLLAQVGQARTTLIFEQVNIERGAELLAEMKTEEAFRVLDELASKRAAQLVASMPRGQAAKMLRSMPPDDAIRMLIAMEANPAAGLLTELDIGIFGRLVDAARPQVVAAILERSDAERTGTFLMELPEQRALSILTKMNSFTIPRLVGSLDSDAERWLLARIPAPQIGQVVRSLSLESRIEALCDVLSADRAGVAILSWDHHYLEEDGNVYDLLLTLENMPADRLAAIMQTIDQHERTLILAIMDRPCRQRVLAELPSSDAKAAEEGLLPQNLIEHVAGADLDRACKYLDYLEIPAKAIISGLPPEIAAEIIKRKETYASMASMLADVPLPHAALIMQSMRAGDAAGIMERMPVEVAALALTSMSPASADRIMAYIDERSDPEVWGGFKLSREERTEERVKRERFASFLRATLADARRTE